MTTDPTSPSSGAADPRALDRTDMLVFGTGLSVAALLAAVAQWGGMPRVQSFVGLVVIMLIAYAWSTNRRAIHLPPCAGAWGCRSSSRCSC